jgi:hypothetical protein
MAWDRIRDEEFIPTSSNARLAAVSAVLLDRRIVASGASFGIRWAIARLFSDENWIGPFLSIKYGATAKLTAGGAGAIGLLASDAASYVNDLALPVDRGLSSSLPFARPTQLGQTIF